MHQSIACKAYLKGLDASSIYFNDNIFKNIRARVASKYKSVNWNTIEDCFDIKTCDELPFKSKMYVAQNMSSQNLRMATILSNNTAICEPMGQMLQISEQKLS